MATQALRNAAGALPRIGFAALFIGQGLLKSVIFLMPGTIAYFEAMGYPAWVPAAIVTVELFLVVQMALSAGVCPMPRRTHGAQEKAS